MDMYSQRGWALVALSILGLMLPEIAWAGLMLGSEEIVRASGLDLLVSGYSVPEYCDWNNDGRRDLVIGEGGGTPGKVRVYLNGGTAATPNFTTYSYAQSNGLDLSVPAGGCLGAFPRTVQWDADGCKDLLVGRSDGTVMLFHNINTNADPRFDGGTTLQYGVPGQKVNINVGGRAAPAVVDWNNDGRKDLVVGGIDGTLRLYINEGTDAAPDFRTQTLVQGSSGALTVPSGRASPMLLDLTDDGRKDLLAGNTNGQLLLYANTGTDVAPVFGTYTAVTANGAAIDLPGTPRSRPFVCDWTGDGLTDVLIGSGDGKVRLYEGVPEPAGLVLLAALVAVCGGRFRVARPCRP